MGARELAGLTSKGVQDEEGVKDGDNREDDSRQDKRPKPLGPATTSLDKAMSEA